MAMVVVNSAGHGGHVYAPLRHARWNGLTIADMVFPAFVTFLGASLWLSNEHERRAGTRTAVVVARIVRRSLLLVGLGLALHAFPRPDFPELRLPGVLQRLGLITLLVGLVLRLLSRRQQAAVAIALMVSYAVLLRWVQVPGVGHAAMTPTENWPGWLDMRVFGQRHVYGNGGYDPEGILSTFAATVTALGGAWITRFIARREQFRIVAGWCALALLAGFLGILVNPLNKRMWTPSFGAVTGAIACGLLVACEHRMRRHGHSGPHARLIPTMVTNMVTNIVTNMGRRSLEIYLLSEVANDALHRYHPRFADGDTLRGWAYRRYAGFLPLQMASLAYALTLLAAWCSIAAILVGRNWRLRL